MPIPEEAKAKQHYQAVWENAINHCIQINDTLAKQLEARGALIAGDILKASNSGLVLLRDEHSPYKSG